MKNKKQQKLNKINNSIYLVILKQKRYPTSKYKRLFNLSHKIIRCLALKTIFTIKFYNISITIFFIIYIIK